MSLVRVLAAVFGKVGPCSRARHVAQQASAARVRRRLCSNNTGAKDGETESSLHQVQSTEQASTLREPRGPQAELDLTSSGDNRLQAESTDQTDFKALFESSPIAAEVGRGTLLRGRIVSAQLPYIRVDFGLKREVPFLPAEILGEGKVGDEVIMPLIAMEDDFQEPVLDFSGQYYKPLVMAERYQLWEPPPEEEQDKELNEGRPRFLFGRVASLKRGGFNAKVLGIEAFLPRKQSLVLVRRDDAADANPFIGSYMPFVLLSANFFVEGVGDANAAGPSAGMPVTGGRMTVSAYGTKRVRVLPVVSNYASFLYILVDLLHHADRFGLSPEERVAYLRLLTRILWSRNSHIRRLHVMNTVPRVQAMVLEALMQSEERTQAEDGISTVRDSSSPREQKRRDPQVLPEQPFSETRGAAVAEDTIQSRRRRASLLRELAKAKEPDK